MQKDDSVDGGSGSARTDRCLWRTYPAQHTMFQATLTKVVVGLRIGQLKWKEDMLV